VIVVDDVAYFSTGGAEDGPIVTIEGVGMTEEVVFDECFGG
jgi:hypothetical protein